MVTDVPPAIVPARGPRLFVASVNVVSACNKELCPSAVILNNAPHSSSSTGTVQVEMMSPFSSAVVNHGA